jgi:hypothetical protein
MLRVRSKAEEEGCKKEEVGSGRLLRFHFPAFFLFLFFALLSILGNNRKRVSFRPCSGQQSTPRKPLRTS